MGRLNDTAPLIFSGCRCESFATEKRCQSQASQAVSRAREEGAAVDAVLELFVIKNCLHLGPWFFSFSTSSPFPGDSKSHGIPGSMRPIPSDAHFQAVWKIRPSATWRPRHCLVSNDLVARLRISK